MNLKIKFRESFRPFAPCVLREDAGGYFKIRPDVDSPYMLLVADVKEDKRLNTVRPEQNTVRGLDKLRQKRSIIPAVTHVDFSARIQTVDENRHPKLHRLISRFKDKTGCPVIINTSFNIRGEPIVCTPEQAYRCFMATDMDVLVLQNQLLYKNEQPQTADSGIEQYKVEFTPD
jgi:carbamoyltransferase